MSRTRGKADLYGRYYTPRWLVEQGVKTILPTIGLVPEAFLDPCCGHGIFGEVIRDTYKLRSSVEMDLYPSDYSTFPCDYLTWKAPYKFNLCMSNPPYNQAELFVRKALREAWVVCFLLRLNWLGSQARNKFFRVNPPSDVFVTSKRPLFMKRGSDATEYSYIVWDQRTKTTETKLHWLPLPERNR